MRIPLLPTFTVALSLCVLLLSGCNDKQNEKNPFSTAENNTTFSPVTQSEKNHTLSGENTTQLSDTAASSADMNISATEAYTFQLADQHGVQYDISVDHTHLLLNRETPAVVVLYFFSTWSLPCRGETPYLTKLKKKYAHDILVIGILLHPDEYLDTLDDFIKENNADFFISSSSDNDRFAAKVTETLDLSNVIPIPLTIMYHHGTYARHYEGAVPVEMLEHDIQSLLQKGDR